MHVVVAGEVVASLVIFMLVVSGLCQPCTASKANISGLIEAVTVF